MTQTLLDYIRSQPSLTGTKKGCGEVPPLSLKQILFLPFSSLAQSHQTQPKLSLYVTVNGLLPFPSLPPSPLPFFISRVAVARARPPSPSTTSTSNVSSTEPSRRAFSLSAMLIACASRPLKEWNHRIILSIQSKRILRICTGHSAGIALLG